MSIDPKILELWKQVGRCAFGLTYEEGLEPRCELKAKGLYCRTHHPFGKMQRAEHKPRRGLKLVKRND